MKPDLSETSSSSTQSYNYGCSSDAVGGLSHGINPKFGYKNVRKVMYESMGQLALLRGFLSYFKNPSLLSLIQS